MDSIELFLHRSPDERLVGERLVELLKDWIGRTPQGDRLVDVELGPDGQQAVARLQEEERVVEVRLHHEGGPESHRLSLDAWTWVLPTLPSRRVAWLAGLGAGLVGLLITWIWLSQTLVGFVMGTVASALLAVLVANLAWNSTVMRRIRKATDASGGQKPARSYLAELSEILHQDSRVETLTER